MTVMGLKRLCRTCLCSEGVVFPLFDEIQELKETGFGTAVEVLETFTFVPIRNNNYLPDHICATCLNEIQRAYSFTLKCEKSETILNQLKEVKVNLKKLKESPNRYEFESESNCELKTIKEEPEEIDFYDHEDGSINDNAIKSISKLNRMSHGTQFVKVRQKAENHVTFKNEPELNIEDMECGHSELKIDEELKCLGCKKQFKSADVFREHTATDDIEGNVCKLCNEEFDCSQSEHSVKHVPINYFDEITIDNQSNVCKNFHKETINEQIQNQMDYNKDVEMEHTDPKTHKSNMKTNDHITDPKFKYPCSVCSKGFTYKHGLIRHMVIHTGENQFKCSFCTEQFRHAPKLRIHMEMKHLNELPGGKPQFQCNICLKILATRNQYVQHMLIHTDEKPFRCEWCSQKFRYRQTMVNHSLTTHAEELANEKPKYKCSVCSKSFKYESDSVIHMRKHADEKGQLPIEDTIYECKLCSKKFSYKTNLNKHMRSHSIPKREWRSHSIPKRECKICFEKFRHNRLLALHMEKKHINDLLVANAQNQCKICLKLFGHKYSLGVHMRSHTGENPFQCEFCSSGFQRKYLLRVHVERKHLNEMPAGSKPKYQCNVCSRIFEFDRNLVSHMRSHTGEKPFKCEVCLGTFGYYASLFRHIEMRHQEEDVGINLNYPCPVCSKAYGYEMILKVHMKTKHAMKFPFVRN